MRVGRLGCGVTALACTGMLLSACADETAPPTVDTDAALPMYFEPGDDAGMGDAWAMAEAGDLDIAFDVRIGAQSVACDGFYGPAGTTDSQVEFRELRLYVHDVVLIDEDGGGVRAPFVPDGEYQSERVALLDFEDGSGACATGDAKEHRSLRVVAPAGRYVGVAFKLGVPEADNHGDAASAPPPLDRTALFWSWQDGHKFMRVDTTTEAGSPIEFHLGSTACTKSGDQTVCAESNRPEVRLLAFDPAQEQVVLDYGALVAEVDLETELPGCIAGAGPEVCDRMFAALGLSIDTGDADPGAQTVFRTAPR